MYTHELKTIAPYFEHCWSGNKRFEIRKNDRNFQIGDVILLKEYDANSNEYSGRTISIEIEYILKDYPELAKDYIVFSFSVLPNFY